MRPPAIDALRAQVEKDRRPSETRPIGAALRVAAVVSRLPGRGRAALHCMRSPGRQRHHRWCRQCPVHRRHRRAHERPRALVHHPAGYFAPAVAQAACRPIGLPGGRRPGQCLACMEERLRHGGLRAVVGEVAQLSMKASRRLMLTAEVTGTIGLALRLWRRQTDATDFGQPTATATLAGVGAALHANAGSRY